MAIEGLGATLTRSGYSWKIKSISGIGVTYESIETTDLSTTGYKKYMATALGDIGEIRLECYFDGTYPTGGSDTAATTRITFRNGKYWEASMYCLGYEVGDVTPGEAQMMTITLKAAGGASAITTG